MRTILPIFGSIAILCIAAFLTTGFFQAQGQKQYTVNENAVYLVRQVPNTCFLRILNGADGKEYYISSLSTKRVRYFLNRPAIIKGTILNVDKLSPSEKPSMALTDDCKINPFGDSKIAIKVDDIRSIYDYQYSSF